MHISDACIATPAMEMQEAVHAHVHDICLDMQLSTTVMACNVCMQLHRCCANEVLADICCAYACMNEAAFEANKGPHLIADCVHGIRVLEPDLIPVWKFHECMTAPYDEMLWVIGWQFDGM